MLQRRFPSAPSRPLNEPLPPSLLAALDASDVPDAVLTLLRKEEAMALVMSSLKLMRTGWLDGERLRAQARRILESQSGRCYCYENSIDEIVEDLVWILN